MPRRPRKRSDSGIYHVMLRGTNKQQICHDDKDDQTFLVGLHKYKDLCGFQLFAWCLMPNHLHLQLRESKESEPIDKIMRRLSSPSSLPMPLSLGKAAKFSVLYPRYCDSNPVSFMVSLCALMGISIANCRCVLYGSMPRRLTKAI